LNPEISKSIKYRLQPYASCQGSKVISRSNNRKTPFFKVFYLILASGCVTFKIYQS